MHITEPIDLDNAVLKYKKKDKEVQKEFKENILHKYEWHLITLLSIILIIFLIFVFQFGGLEAANQFIEVLGI